MKNKLKYRMLLALKFCAFAAISLCFNLAVQAQPSAVVAPGNFHVVVSHKIYRGARPMTEGEVKWLSNLGVKTIIDLQGGDPKAFWVFEDGEWPAQRNLEHLWAHENHVHWLNYPLDSAPALGVQSKEAGEINKVLDVMRNPAYQPVFVHCEHGKDRTGLVVALYQVFYEKPPMTPTAAYREMYADGHSPLLRAMDGYFNLATTPPMSLHKCDHSWCWDQLDLYLQDVNVQDINVQEINLQSLSKH